MSHDVVGGAVIYRRGRVVAIDVVVEDARCGCRNGGENVLLEEIFSSVSSLDNGTEGGVAKHPTTCSNFKGRLGESTD